jgi:hypothetical protein
MRCRVSLSTLAQRLVLATYLGKASGVVGSNYNYAYALSDVVPAGNFWVVVYASSISLQTGGAERQGLWVINPGPLPASNLSPYQNNLYFFQGATPVTVANGPPVGPYAMRVDEINDNNTDSFRNGAEQVLLRSKKLVVPEGCTLMAHGGQLGIGSGGGLGEQFQLMLCYAQFSNDEISEGAAVGF